MQLTISSDYAIRIVCLLAEENRMCSTTMIAEKLNIPNSYIPKIAKKLKDNSIIRAAEGIQGGYQLSKSPNDISLLDILNIMESTLKLNHCLECDHECSRNATAYCNVHQVFGTFQKEFEYYLQRVTIAQLVNLPEVNQNIETYFVTIVANIDNLDYQIIYSSDYELLEGTNSDNLIEFSNDYVKKYVYSDDQEDIKEILEFKEVTKMLSDRRWGKEIYFRKKDSQNKLGYIWVLMQLGIDDKNNKLFITMRDAKLVEHYMNKVEKKVVKKIHDDEKKYWDKIRFITKIFNKGDFYNTQRVENCIRYTQLIYQKLVETYPKLDINKAEIENVPRLVPVRDIGWITIFNGLKNDFNKSDNETVKAHTIIGAEIFDQMAKENSISYLNKYSHDICLYHHERYDGKGYPEQLSGDEIPRCAQIAGIVDSYVLLTDPIGDEVKYTKEEAIQMIIAGKCGAFSPQLIHCFIQATTDSGWEKDDDYENKTG